MAETNELEAKKKALLFLSGVREKMEEVRQEYERAYSRLLSSLQYLKSEEERIEKELSEIGNPELKESKTSLLGTPSQEAPSIAAIASTKQQIEPDKASEDERAQAPPSQAAGTSEAVKATIEKPLEQHPQEQQPDRETDVTPSTYDKTLYAGEVELDIAAPVHLETVSKLCNYLQTVPEIKIMHTTGTRERGPTIAISLEKPVPLIALLSKMEELETTLVSEKDDLAGGKSSLLGGTRKSGIKRIKLVPKARAVTS